MDPLEPTTHPSVVGAAQPTLLCQSCKKAVSQDTAALVGKKKTDVVTTACPTCKRLPSPDARPAGCCHCGQGFFVSSALAGHLATCLWCTRELTVPVRSEQEALGASGKTFKWLVFRNDSLLQQFESKEELVAAMHSREVLPSDVCMVHRFAEPTSLRSACNKDASLQSLYDPIGAKASQIGGAVFVACAALYLIADFYILGWRQSIIFLAAIACVTVLRQHFWVGFIALFVLGKLFGVPVGGGTFLSLLIEGLSTALAGAVGGGIAYGATYLIGRAARWNERAVVWRGIETR